MLEILLIFSPDDWFEEVIDNSDKAGWMDNKASFEIFLVSPVHHLVETPQPGERRFVSRGETVVEVDKTVVDINILVQCQHQVPGGVNTPVNNNFLNIIPLQIHLKKRWLSKVLFEGSLQADTTIIFLPPLSSPTTSTIPYSAMSR